MIYYDWIEQLKAEWIGKIIKYDGKTYKVIGVDYNGLLLINKATRHSFTTAVAKYMVDVI